MEIYTIPYTRMLLYGTTSIGLIFLVQDLCSKPKVSDKVIDTFSIAEKAGTE